MKFKFIILTLIVISLSFLSSCSKNEPTAKIEKLDEKKWQKEIADYSFEKLRLSSLQKTNDFLEQSKEIPLCYKDSVNNIVYKKEIVYIKRMASSSVMNSPAFYNKTFSRNTIRENGRGAENEDFVVIYLSDGKIIKATPTKNPEWMGVLIGEKVIKTTGKKLQATYKTTEYISPETDWQIYAHKTFYIDKDILTTLKSLNYVDYTTYQPLYQK
ncbi:MAG: hypothetical protein J6J35_03140 [Alphaproteobacteria bacterium]|nr:hypothetical protein [Alphaproteobacteria bacterium]